MMMFRLSGSQLHAARVLVELSREEVAKRAGLCRHSIHKWKTSSHAIPGAMYSHLGRVVDLLEDLAKARAYGFAFIMQPLKLEGAIRFDGSADCDPLRGKLAMSAFGGKADIAPKCRFVRL